MNELLRLAYEFFKTGLFSIGGGLATLPFLYEMSRETGWFSYSDIADMIAISESTPGAIGINMSTYSGYITCGIIGGVVSTLSLATPSVIIILIISRILDKFRSSPLVEKLFYGLRPASMAMIAAAGMNVAQICFLDSSYTAGDPNILHLFSLKAVILAIPLFIGLRKLKWHPAVFLGIAALAGIALQLGVQP